MSIVLAEDKQYYADATVVYEGAETIHQDEDMQPITVPIIAPKKYVELFLVLHSSAESLISTWKNQYQN
jgi:hypothetical protein